MPIVSLKLVHFHGNFGLFSAHTSCDPSVSPRHTVSKQECFGLERIGIFPIIDSLDRSPYLHLPLPLRPGFHMIIGDRLVKCSAIVMIIWKPNFHFASNRQQFQQLPTVRTIVSDRKKLMETTSAATAAIFFPFLTFFPVHFYTTFFTCLCQYTHLFFVPPKGP